jgi:hypothetical protein
MIMNKKTIAALALGWALMMAPPTGNNSSPNPDAPLWAWVITGVNDSKQECLDQIKWGRENFPGGPAQFMASSPQCISDTDPRIKGMFQKN